MKVTVKNHAKTCIMISAAIMIIALLMTLFGYGIHLGIDFTGGILMRYQMGQAFSTDDVRAALEEQGISESQISVIGDEKTEMEVRIKDIENSDAVRTALEDSLRKTYPGIQFVSIGRVGAVAGQDLIKNALISVLVAWALMLVYIAIRFDLYSGMAAVFGILHDVLIMISFMVILRSFVQVNSTFIAALLTIIGYSINNTIVIFDRIRENNGKRGLGHMRRDEIVSQSVNESLTRTINTTLTTLITTVLLYALGVDSVKEFALPLIIGMLSGIWASNMINGYVWAYLLDKRDAMRLKAKKA